MNNSDIHSGLEARKLINISLDKIAASRTGRTGTSLHKSLLVASVLHKARYVFLEEQCQHNLYCHQQSQLNSIDHVHEPPRAQTPIPEVTVTPVVLEHSSSEFQSEDSIYSDFGEYDFEGLTETNDENKENSLPLSFKHDREDDEEYERAPLGDTNSRKRRRTADVTEQETAAAISSILPKRLRSDDEGDSPVSPQFPEFSCSPVEDFITPLSPAVATAVDDDDEECNMEVDHITSLVSIFSFTQHAQDLCSTQAHQAEGIGGMPVVALTA